MIAAYAAAVVVAAMLDVLWLGVIAKDLYRRHLGHLMSADTRWSAAALFYLVYAAGLLYFVVGPALAERSLRKALGNGALMGLFVYTVYDLTNLAVLRGWTAAISAVDIAWGGLMTATAAGAAYLAAGV